MASGALAAICSFFYFAYCTILKTIKLFYQKTDKTEKYFICIAVIAFSILIVIAYSLTYVFYGTEQYNEIAYDIIYTSDSGDLYSSNCWVNVVAGQNDIRQPLFAVFAAPFSIIAFIISNIFFFVPNLYAYLIAIEQVVLLLITIVLLIRLLNLEGLEKIFASVLFTVAFPTFLFALNMEQYVFAGFYLIAFIYTGMNYRSDSDKMLISAAGSLIISGMCFPLIYDKNRKISENLIKLLKLGIVFVAICFIAGNGMALMRSVITSIRLTRFTGKEVGIVASLQQYSNFVYSTLFYPESYVVNNSLQLVPCTAFNFLGIVILAVCIIGFILNYKNKLAKVAFYWLCLSFVMLGLIGWGAAENGMVLYTLYFGWPFVSLIVLLINKIPKRVIAIRFVIYVALIGVLLYININGLIQVLDFGMTYYHY